MEKLKNIPKLRFPEFNGEWENKKLGEVAEFKVTNSLSRENLNYESGDVKNIHYGDIHTKFQTLFDITKEDVPFINEEIPIQRITEDYYCKEGDLVFADASEDLNDVGKSIEIVKLDNQKLLSGLHTLLARPKENHFSIGFNGYLFKSNTIRKQIQKEAQGSKVLSINVGRISKVELSFPTLSEQKRIASFFTVIDKKIAELKQKKNLLEQYKKGVMQKLFSQELRFKHDNGKDFPKWEKKILSDLVKIMYGKDQKQVADENGIYPILGTGGIMGKTNQFLYDKPSVLIGRKGTIDKPVYMDTPFWTVDTLFYTEVFSNTFPKWLFYKFQTINWYLYNEASGVPSLSGSTIYRIKIETPCYSEQTKIANFLSAIDEKINRTENQIRQTQQYKKGLLQKMFV